MATSNLTVGTAYASYEWHYVMWDEVSTWRTEYLAIPRVDPDMEMDIGL